MKNAGLLKNHSVGIASQINLKEVFLRNIGSKEKVRCNGIALKSNNSISIVGPISKFPR